MATATSPKCSRVGASHPQDCCWGVPLVSMCVCFLLCMVQSSTGYLYVLFMDKYQINRGMASWPESIMLFCQHLGGFLVSLLLTRISICSVLFVSASVSCVGLLCAAFAPDITWMSVTLGAIYGTGFGAALVSLSVFTMRYFDMYTATATSFKYVGWSTSGVAGPLVLSALAANYGLGGALLLSASIALHAVPLVMFLKSPRPINVKCTQCQSLVFKVRRSSKVNELKSDRHERAPDKSSSTQKKGLSSTVQGKLRKEQEAGLASPLTAVNSVSAGCDTRAVSASPPSFLCASASCVVFVTSPTAPRDGKEFAGVNTFHTIRGQREQEKPTKRSTLIKTFSAQLTLFRDPEFYTLLVALTLFDFSVSMHTTTTVDYGRDKGATLEDATLVITYNAVGQFLGRTLLPFASDGVHNGRFKFTVACLAGAALWYEVLSAVTSFPAFVALNVALALSEGFVTCIRGVLINDCLGLERLPAFFGFQGMAIVPFSLSGPTIIGFFRDTLGSYDNFYRMLGAVNLCVAGLMFILLWQASMKQKTLKLPVATHVRTGTAVCVSDKFSMSNGSARNTGMELAS